VFCTRGYNEAGQDLQLDKAPPLVDEYFPAVHREQKDQPTALNLPALHCLHEVAPSLAYLPAGQTLQVLPPVTPLNLPVAQSLQWPRPAKLWTLPAAHCEHFDTEATELPGFTDPAGHILHALPNKLLTFSYPRQHCWLHSFI